MKKLRAAAVVTLATVGWQKAKDYARDNPDQASQALDKVEGFVRGRVGPQHASKIDAGGSAVRSGLGLPKRTVTAPPVTDPQPVAGSPSGQVPSGPADPSI